MRRLAPTIAILVASCTPPTVATVSIGLTGVPEIVRTISVSVIDLERDLVVASATVTPPTTELQLGVPAEVPLLFVAIARTDRPGPLSVGGVMPAYVARSERTIPLGNEQFEVSLAARPAGVLTIAPRLDDDVDDDIDLRLVEEGESSRSVRVPLQQPTSQVSVVLPTGRYLAMASPFEIPQSRGLFVEREQESVAVLHVLPARDPMPRRLASVTVAIEDAGMACASCRDVITSTLGTTSVGLRIEGWDESLEPINVSGAMVTLEVEAFPPTLLVSRPTAEPTALPARVPGLVVQGRGRIVVSAIVTAEGEAIRGALYANVRRLTDLDGDPARIELSVVDLDRIAAGTELVVSILDADGRYARSIEGRLDFAASSPFLFLPEGTVFDLAGDERGVVLRPIARPSGPRGVAVSAIATLTSTTIMGTWTSTLALPLLELPNG